MSKNILFIGLSVLPFAFWFVIIVLLRKAKARGIKIGELRLRSYAIGYGICAAFNFLSLFTVNSVIFMPVYIVFYYFASLLPFVFFSVMLSERFIREMKRGPVFVRFLYKTIAIVLIWVFPLNPILGTAALELSELPDKRAHKQATIQLQEEIMELEVFADLTYFGLGIYKLQNEGDEWLWDITEPRDNAIVYNETLMVYDNLYNSRYHEVWDNHHQGKDVLYDVVFYEGTYIIISPLLKERNAELCWAYLYLCKSIDRDADIFAMGVRDPAFIDTLKELPVEQISRKDLVDRLGLDF